MDNYTEAEVIAPFQWKRVTTDGDVGIIIEYFGPLASCKITVADATGDISSAVGALGAEATDTTFLEPGGTEGTIDVSDVLADTFGELVNVINAIPYYRARLVDVLPADSSNDTLLAMAATQAKVAGGLKLYKDTSVALNVSMAVSGEDFNWSENGCKNEIAGYVIQGTGTGNTVAISLYQGTTLKYSLTGLTITTDYSKTMVEFTHGAVGQKLLMRVSHATMTAGTIAIGQRSARLAPIRKRPST